MRGQKFTLFMISLFTALVLAACSDGGNGNNHENMDHGNTNQEKTDNKEMNHSEMNHSSSGEIPKGLKEAKNPTYKVGSEVIIKSDHMEGMNGAEATVVGAYDTTVYTVSYTPTTGGKKVTNHKWVIHEELKDAAGQPYKQGDKVILMADHMKGMNGAPAIIDTAEKTTVYMVDYTPTTGGEKVTNHQWVTESELSAK